MVFAKLGTPNLHKNGALRAPQTLIFLRIFNDLRQIRYPEYKRKRVSRAGNVDFLRNSNDYRQIKYPGLVMNHLMIALMCNHDVIGYLCCVL